MIKNLNSSSTYITVQNPYLPTTYMNGMNVGQVRYNPTMQQLEVYDGSQWLMISNGATVGLSYEADSAIRWAIEKQQQEAELKIKIERYPALKDAYDKFKMMEALAYDETENT